MAPLLNQGSVFGGVLQQDVEQVGVRLEQDPLQLFVGISLGNVGQDLRGQQGRPVWVR